MSGYLPIAEHALVADVQSVAPVGSEATIVFAAMLDAGRGGRYRLGPAVAGWTTKRLYFPHSNVPGPGMCGSPVALTLVSALRDGVAARASERLRRMPGAAA